MGNLNARLFWILKNENLLSDLLIYLAVIVIFLHILNDIRLNSKKSKALIFITLTIFVAFSLVVPSLRRSNETLYHKVRLDEYNYYDYQLDIPDYINLISSKISLDENLMIEFSTGKTYGFIEVKKNMNYIEYRILLDINGEVAETLVRIVPKESQQAERYFFDQGLVCETSFQNESYGCDIEMIEGNYIISIKDLIVDKNDELQLFIASSSKLGFEIYNDYSVNIRRKK